MRLSTLSRMLIPTMKLSKFLKLKQAISRLDLNLIAKRILKLDEHLQKHGLALEPENTAMTEEGIFYIEPETGMATKVVLYIAGDCVSLEKHFEKEICATGCSDEPTLKTMHPYHILRCNTLRQSEQQGWKENYKITQRTTGSFYYCLVNEKAKAYQEIENQKLLICENCFTKVTSILTGIRGSDREKFMLQRFFDVDFIHSWNSYHVLPKERGFLTGIYPDDWLEICRIKKQQVDYHCEACLMDLSHPLFKKYLYVQSTDHIKRQVGYIKLECLCISCMAEQASGQDLKETSAYRQYMELRNQGQRKDEKAVEQKRKDRPRVVVKRP